MDGARGMGARGGSGGCGILQEWGGRGEHQKQQGGEGKLQHKRSSEDVDGEGRDRENEEILTKVNEGPSDGNAKHRRGRLQMSNGNRRTHK